MKAKLVIVAVAMLWLDATALAQTDGTLGVYSDAVRSSCCITAPPGQVTTAHVIATLAGATGGGITGAEFRLDIPNQQNYPFMTWTGDPASNIQLGNPLDSTPGDPNDFHGLTMAFPACQPVGGGMPGANVALGTLTILNFGVGGHTPIHVKRRQPPSNPTAFDCPLFVLCDTPVFTIVCLTPQASGEPEEPIHFTAHLNPMNCAQAGTPDICGTVAAAPSSWTVIKTFYR